MTDVSYELKNLYQALEVANAAVLNTMNALSAARNNKEIDIEIGIDLTYLLCDIMENLASHTSAILEYAAD